MDNVHPMYKKLLIIALVIYVIGVTVIQADLMIRAGKIEHRLVHITGK